MISHTEDGRYILNLHALHNATHIRRILPRHLTKPQPLYIDREARHHEIATALRVTQESKRTATRAKTKATKDANLKIHGEVTAKDTQAVTGAEKVFI